MASLADLVINLTAETASLTAGLAKAQADVSSFATRVESQLESLKSVGEGLLGALGIEKLSEAFMQTIEQMEQLGRTAQKVAVDVESLAALQHGAFMSGVDVDTLNTGLAKLAKNIGEAASGAGPAARNFQALGISIKDANANLRPTIDVFTQIANKFASAQDDVAKTTFAMDLFGKAGANLIPLLDRGGAGMEEYRRQAQQFGLILDPEVREKVERLGESIKTLQERSKGLWQQIVAESAPTLKLMADSLDELGNFHIPQLVHWFVAAAYTIGSVIGALAITVADDLAVISAMIYHAVTGNFDAVKNDWKQFTAYGTDLWKTTAKQIADAWNNEMAKTATPGETGGGKGRLPQPPGKDRSNELNAALAFFNDLKTKTAKANQDVIGEINAKWDAEYAKVEQFKKKYPQLIGEALDAEYQIRLAKRREIAEAEQKLLMDANKAVADLVKAQEPGLLTSVPLGANPSAPTFSHNPLQAQIDALSGNNMQAAIDRGKLMDDLFMSTRTNAELYAAELTKINFVYKDHSTDEYKRALASIQDQYDLNTIALRDFATQGGQALQGLITGTETWQNALKGVFEQLVLLIPKLLLANEIQSMMGQGGSTGFFGSLLGGLLGVGHRAGGGDVQSSAPYVVGEVGPELFIPSQSGTIMPNSALRSMGGGMTIAVNNDFRGVDAATIPYVEQRVAQGVRVAVQQALAKGADQQRRR